jgi:hypothetical protein
MLQLILMAQDRLGNTIIQVLSKVYVKSNQFWRPSPPQNGVRQNTGAGRSQRCSIYFYSCMLQELVQSIAVLQGCGLITVEILGGWKNFRSRPDLVSHFDCHVAQSTFTLRAGDFPIQSINEAFDITSNMTTIQKFPNELMSRESRRLHTYKSIPPYTLSFRGMSIIGMALFRGPPQLSI